MSWHSETVKLTVLTTQRMAQKLALPWKNSTDICRLHLCYFKMSEFEQEWCSVIGVFNQRPAQTKSSQQIIILNIISIFLQSSQQIKVFKKIILFLKVVPKVIYLSNFLLRVVWAKLIAIMGNWHKNRILPQSIEFSFV